MNFFLTMADTVTFQNIDLSFWITLYFRGVADKILFFFLV
jgi:hypothetical protein